MRKKVLIVDDAIYAREIIKEALEGEKYEVIAEAEGGKECIQLYKKLKPDVVLLDIVMPDLDGIETLEKLINIDKDAKVIIISSLGQEMLIKEAINKGAKGFITKPFSPLSLINILDELFKEKH